LKQLNRLKRHENLIGPVAVAVVVIGGGAVVVTVTVSVVVVVVVGEANDVTCLPVLFPEYA
jgi:hypothetical protein